METLKKEAAEVQRKMEETDTVMAEVEMVSQQYLPLSTACSSMYFTLESLNQVLRYSIGSVNSLICICIFVLMMIHYPSCCLWPIVSMMIAIYAVYN